MKCCRNVGSNIYKHDSVYIVLVDDDGSNSDPCEATYRGTAPASEPETIAIQEELMRLGPNLTALW